ncbi:heterokaryon incompatibility protein [Colletotrichum orchidophilum]|uniref:Heterokaryon incompatibility protein n=1 Tax=Colletotrichum orchidophilum TaxID=1209926 RepID=A0A1G4BKK7_9PEZI|nr:heterokaryon incompatibility protein [Colletotrichum orchidophilum]OHF02010.1 heterokaryon incompatibility protein [Colletotrichum orchidophilum]
MDSIYVSRLRSRRIRILVLQPGPDTGPMRLGLQEVSIDDPPAFEALSYVWGDPSQVQEIECLGYTVPITQNLFDALRHFRRPDRALLIWADALCINQDDMDERAEQVQLMREIYSRAKRVVVWLGLDDKGQASRAMSLIETIHQACNDHALAKNIELLSMAHFTPATQALEGLAGVSIENITAVAERSGKAEPTSEDWEALGWLLSRPWFTRVWCVQEIVLARLSRIYVGSGCLDWVKLGVTTAWLSEQHLANDYDVPPEIEGLPFDNAHAMFDTSEISDSTFLEVLIAFRDHHATNLRDKVYGLLGLMSPENLELFPSVDYRKSLAEVYVDVVVTAVRGSQTLSALCYVQHGVEYQQTEMSSWVPRWDVSGDVLSILDSLSVTAWKDGDKHGLPGLKEFTPSSDGKVSVSGVRFDTIAWITRALDVRDFREHVTTSAASLHPILDLWTRASSRNSYPGYPQYENSLMAVSMMALTLTAGLTDGYERVELKSSDDCERFHADYLNYVHKLFKIAGQKSSTFEPLDIAHWDGNASRFRIAASRACDQRRVFETKSGYYGLAPACTREGDVVVMLYGGPIPFALRKVDNGWLLLGDCFIDPLMPEAPDEKIRARFGEEEVFVLL